MQSLVDMQYFVVRVNIRILFVCVCFLRHKYSTKTGSAEVRSFGSFFFVLNFYFTKVFIFLKTWTRGHGNECSFFIFCSKNTIN